MAKRLTGRNPLSYVGVEALTPANTVTSKVNPTTKNFRNFEIGDVWVNTESEQVWIIVDKNDESGTWIEMAAASGVGASNFTTDVGTAVDLAGTINVLGGDLITTDALVANTVTVSLDNGTDGQIIIGSTAGSPAYGNLTSTGGTITISEGSNTLNIEADITGFAEDYVTDSGTAQPMGGVLNIVGDGNLETSGTGDEVHVAITNGTNGQVLIGGGSDAQWANITSSGGTITITNGANSINIESTTDGTNDFVTDSGTATQSGNSINVIGDGNVLSTTGAGDTVTVSLDNGTNGQLLIGGGAGPAWANLTSTGATITITNGANSINLEALGGGSSGASTFHTDGADATQAAGEITMAGGTLITTSGAGSTVTFNLDNGTDGQLIIGSTAGSPAYANLTSSGGTIVITNGSNSINLEATGGGSSGASQFDTDGASATEAAGVIVMAGGSNIATSGAGNTVTFDVASSPSFSGSVTAGTGLTVTTGGITSTGTTRLTSLGAGVVQTNGSGTVSSSNGTNGEILIGGGSAPAWANLTSSDASITITNGANTIDLSAAGAGGGSTVTTFTSSDTWTKAAGTKFVTVFGWSGGGGGGSGRRGVSGASTGGGGGGTGSCFMWSGPASFFGATEPVTVGVGGTGGAAVTTNNTNGNDGNPGTNSAFGNLIFPVVVSEGLGGNTIATNGGQAAFIFTSSLSQTLSQRNSPVNVSVVRSVIPAPLSNSTKLYAGGGGETIADLTAPDLGGSILAAEVYRFTGFAATGGGAGGFADSGVDANTQAGNGGGLIAMDATTVLQAGAAGGISSGTVNGAVGADAPTSGGIIMGGFGGGGGAGQGPSGGPGNGGNGGFPGGGGGGGGGSLNGTNSGAGGDGGDGLVIVIEW